MLKMNPSETLDMHLRLGIKPGANYEEIKKAYREKALYWHPDRNPETKERAHLEFIAVSEAFEILSNQKDNFKEPFNYYPKAEKGTYEYYENIFNKIFQGDEFDFLKDKISPELKTFIELFKIFR